MLCICFVWAIDSYHNLSEDVRALRKLLEDKKAKDEEEKQPK